MLDRGLGDRAGLREGPLRLPNLCALGLGEACRIATGQVPAGLSAMGLPRARYGFAVEISRGKDTPSGHWEIAGVPVLFDWGYFCDTVPCFPPRSSRTCAPALPGILEDRHAPGTAIIEEMAPSILATLKPICYTSADSVFQIAATRRRSASTGSPRRADRPQPARPVAHGRVIARPFVGEDQASFRRTANRRDYSVPPPAPTLLDRASAEGRAVVSVDRVADIFAHRGTGEVVKGHGNDALFDRTLRSRGPAARGRLLFANYVDFDTEFGHRRDVPGFADALERFDRRLPELLGAAAGRPARRDRRSWLRPDLAGQRSTPEQVPVLAVGGGLERARWDAGAPMPTSRQRCRATSACRRRRPAPTSAARACPRPRASAMSEIRSMCAIGLRGQLGLNGKLPWEGATGPAFIADVARFFDATRGHVLISGHARVPRSRSSPTGTARSSRSARAWPRRTCWPAPDRVIYVGDGPRCGRSTRPTSALGHHAAPLRWPGRPLLRSSWVVAGGAS